MNWDALKSLADSWHEAAAKLEGYSDTTPTGDGVQLMLFVKKKADGDLELTLMSARDWFSVHSLSELLQLEDIQRADIPSIPFASLTIKN